MSTKTVDFLPLFFSNLLEAQNKFHIIPVIV